VVKGEAAWDSEMTRIQKLWPDFSAAHEAYLQGVLVGSNPTTTQQPRRFVVWQQQVFSSVRELKMFVLQQEQSQTRQSQAPRLGPAHQQAMAAQSQQAPAVGDLLQHVAAGVPLPPQTGSPVDQRLSGALPRARGTRETCQTHPKRLPQNIAQGAAAAASGRPQPILMHAQRPAVLTAVQGSHGQQRQGRGVPHKEQKDVRRKGDGWSQLMDTIKQKWTDFSAAHEARIELVRVSYRMSGKGTGGWWYVVVVVVVAKLH
jgi:hypothetical protein